MIPIYKHNVHTKSFARRSMKERKNLFQSQHSSAHSNVYYICIFESRKISNQLN